MWQQHAVAATIDGNGGRGTPIMLLAPVVRSSNDGHVDPGVRAKRVGVAAHRSNSRNDMTSCFAVLAVNYRPVYDRQSSFAKDGGAGSGQFINEGVVSLESKYLADHCIDPEKQYEK